MPALPPPPSCRGVSEATLEPVRRRYLILELWEPLLVVLVDETLPFDGNNVSLSHYISYTMIDDLVDNHGQVKMIKGNYVRDTIRRS